MKSIIAVVVISSLVYVGIILVISSKARAVSVDLTKTVPMSCEEAQTQRMICLETIETKRKRSEFAKCFYVTDKYC